MNKLIKIFSAVIIAACSLPFAFSQDETKGPVPARLDHLILKRIKHFEEKQEEKDKNQFFMMNENKEKTRMILNVVIKYSDGVISHNKPKFILTSGTYDNGEPVKLLKGGNETEITQMVSIQQTASTSTIDLDFEIPTSSAKTIKNLEGEFHLSAAKKEIMSITDLNIKAGKNLSVKDSSESLFKLVSIKEKEIILEQLSKKGPAFSMHLTFYNDKNKKIEKDFMGSKTDYIDNNMQRWTITFKEPLPQSGVRLEFPMTTSEENFIAELSLKDIELP